jgi:hypothetical protein
MLCCIASIRSFDVKNRHVGNFLSLGWPFIEQAVAEAEGRLPLGQEHEVGMGVLAPERPQEPQLVTLQAMNARCAVLGGYRRSRCPGELAAREPNAKLPIIVHLDTRL